MLDQIRTGPSSSITGSSAGWVPRFGSRGSFINLVIINDCAALSPSPARPGGSTSPSPPRVRTFFTDTSGCNESRGLRRLCRLPLGPEVLHRCRHHGPAPGRPCPCVSGARCMGPPLSCAGRRHVRVGFENKKKREENNRRVGGRHSVRTLCRDHTARRNWPELCSPERRACVLVYVPMWLCF